MSLAKTREVSFEDMTDFVKRVLLGWCGDRAPASAAVVNEDNQLT